MIMRIINAENLIIGRMATYVAKRLLLGESIVIVNCEKAVFTGSKKTVFEKFKQRRERGNALKGPYYPRRPDMIVKRIIRGMLPYKQEKGKNAFKKLKCYVSIPEKYSGKNLESIDNAKIEKSNAEKYVDLLTISKQLGAKI